MQKSNSNCHYSNSTCLLTCENDQLLLTQYKTHSSHPVRHWQACGAPALPVLALRAPAPPQRPGGALDPPRCRLPCAVLRSAPLRASLGSCP